jgi:Protein of unknown function (DUF4241)
MDVLLNADYVDAAFAGRGVATPRGEVPCFVREAGNLTVSTGRITACDPLVVPDTEPFTVTVRPGVYPVTLAIAQVSDGDQRVAFARVQFAPGDAVSWRMAVLPGQDPDSLGPDEIFGYSVDAGTGCFMGAAAAALVAERMRAEEEYYETIIEAMDKTYVPTWSYASERPSPRHEENCVAFSSGWGDGVYASYFGYSATGDVVCLVTDFDVLWREPAEAVEPPAAKRWWKFW